MATFSFESITAAQALAYTAADKLNITTAGYSAVHSTVVFIPGDVVHSESVNLTVGAKSVIFATPIEGETDITFTDGSILYIGTPGADADPRAGGAGNDAFFGNDGNDTFSGGAGNNLFQGNKGDDSLVGGAGADTLFGGQDNDQLVTGDSQNFAQGNLGNDTITGGAGADRLYGGKGDDQIISGNGGDYVNGNLGNDSLAGGTGSDSIFGEDGTDTISGGASNSAIPNGGRDYLTGGAGADRFVFGPNDSSVRAGEGDQILDWSTEDRIEFSLAGAGTGANYTETTAATFADAYATANVSIAAGTINYVAVQVGADVVLFADSPTANNGTADIAVVLIGRTLADIDSSNLV